MVSFVRGCYRICPCATWANMVEKRSEVFVWKLQPWCPHEVFSCCIFPTLFIIRLMIGDAEKVSENTHLSASVSIETIQPTLTVNHSLSYFPYSTHFFLKRFGGMSGIWRSPKHGTFGQLSSIAMRFKSSLYSCGGLWVESAFWIRSVAAGLKKLHVCDGNFGPLAQSEPGATKACELPRNNNAGLFPKLFQKDMYMLTKFEGKPQTLNADYSAKIKSYQNSCETQSQEIKPKHMRSFFYCRSVIQEWAFSCWYFF